MRGRHNHLLILPAVADLPERINMGGVILLGFVKNGVHRTQLFVVQAVRVLDCSIHDVVHRRIQLMGFSLHRPFFQRILHQYGIVDSQPAFTHGQTSQQKADVGQRRTQYFIQGVPNEHRGLFRQ